MACSSLRSQVVELVAGTRLSRYASNHCRHTADLVAVGLRLFVHDGRIYPYTSRRGRGFDLSADHTR